MSRLETVAPGLRRWSAWHPEWRQEVGSVAVDTPDGLVLVDPLEPPPEASEPLRLAPESWLEGSTTKKLVKSLLPLLDLPVERILLAHGDPVLQGGKEVLKALIAPEKP